MNALSTRPLPRRATWGGGRLLAVPVVLLLVVILPGCPTGVVHTSTGADVAASTVYAQDIVGDALQTLQDAHNAAVAAHDAKAGLEPADVHAARRAKLLTSAAALRSGWDGLLAWKQGAAGAGMVAIATTVRGSLPDLLSIAVDLKVIPQGTADAIGAFFGLAARGTVPAPLEKTNVVSILLPAHEIDWRAAVQPVHRNSAGAYFDGCNWHTPLPFGGESVTSMGCGYSAQLVTEPLTSTLEWRPTQPAFDPPSLHGEPAITTLEWRPR